MNSSVTESRSEAIDVKDFKRRRMLHVILPLFIVSVIAIFDKNIIASVIIILLTVLNLLGVDTSKRLNDLITVSKLVPLFAFICVGIFFVNGSNFTPVFLNDEYTPGSFAQAAVLLFFAYT